MLERIEKRINSLLNSRAPTYIKKNFNLETILNFYLISVPNPPFDFLLSNEIKKINVGSQLETNLQ